MLREIVKEEREPTGQITLHGTCALQENVLTLPQKKVKMASLIIILSFTKTCCPSTSFYANKSLQMIKSAAK
jgi:hypothetical protein